MSIDEFLGWFFAVCCIIVIGWVLYTFIFGLQVELPAINNGSRYGEGNPHTLNGTPTCEFMVGVDNEPQDGGTANCTFGGGGGSREWIPEDDHWIVKEGNYTFLKWNNTNVSSWVVPSGIVRSGE